MKIRIVMVAAILCALTGSCTISTTTSPHISGSSTTTAPRCDQVKQDCALEERIAAANTYLETRPGTVGFVVRDRESGSVYRSARSDEQVWTASTIKLAMAADLLIKDRAQSIRLSAGDRQLIEAMLHSSDDDAADALWTKYSGSDHLTFNRDFQAFGMTDLESQRGFSDVYPYWGFQKCTPDDLDHLMQYVLDKLDAEDRDYLVNQMKNVAPIQQWGVWAAGPDEHPGNKNGWSEEQGGWVINSVGFTGPDERYTLAIMNALNGEGGYDEGVETISHVARVLLARVGDS